MKVKLFTARPKQNNGMGEMQGILFPDGRIEIGIDLWRNLTKYDFASHPVFEYSSKKQLNMDYEVNAPRTTKYSLLEMKGEEKTWLNYCT